VLNRLDYEALGRIRFDPEAALFRDGPGAYPVTFFHLGRFFPTPVRMYVLSAAQGLAQAREIRYDPDYFLVPPDSPARELPRDAGFAGFRFQESRRGNQQKLDWRRHDWVAFPGASSATLFPDNGKPIPGMVDWHNFRLHFPKDAVLAKTVSLGGRRLETQVLHFDGVDWHAYTFAWRDDQADAERRQHRHPAPQRDARRHGAGISAASSGQVGSWRRQQPRPGR